MILSLSERKILSSFSKLHETLANLREGSSFSSEEEWSDELRSELIMQGRVERKVKQEPVE
jgi:hypothetical protein